MATELRDTQDSQAVELINPRGQGAVVILCEHASNRFPADFGDLGLSDADQKSHAAWDPGARAVALGLSQALDAPLVASTVSRLVYDCNRPPEALSAMPAQSEKIIVPGNRDLDEAGRAARVAQVYLPFRDAVNRLLDARAAAGLPSLIVTIHSFTPVYNDRPRAVEIGILHDENAELADAMLDQAQLLPHRRVERNEPYGPQDGVTHSLKEYGIARDLPNVMIEIRNDLLTNAADEARLTDEMLTLLRPALAALGTETGGTQNA
ncbi:N-formylglutamate amidohydrolase [Roseovarius sp. C7]|uniref:N-formylglutamate amidohydrolase n=1 Tax=Roseovarius sp. C7 TaxID=3398643 RepID=UPI0039F72E8B